MQLSITKLEAYIKVVVSQVNLIITYNVSNVVMLDPKLTVRNIPDVARNILERGVQLLKVDY